MVLDIIQTILDGLMVGSLYAIIALGITLVFGLVGILNFAQGQLVMLGAFICFSAVSAGLGYWFGLVAAMVVMGLFGVLLERTVFRRTLDNPMGGLTVSLGIIMIVENLTAAAASPDPRFIPTPIEGVLQLGELTLSAQRLFVLVAGIVIIGAFYLFIRRSSLGRAIRAMAQNRQGAALAGIGVTRISASIFAISSALAGGVGALYAGLYSISPYMGSIPLMKGFIVATLGGLGSIPGAIVAGCLLGIAESFGARYLSASFRDGYGFIVLIATLLILPNGLFGLRGRSRV